MEIVHVILIILSGIVLFISGLESLFDDDDKCFWIGFVSFFACIALLAFFIIGRVQCEKSEWIVDDEPFAVEKIVSLNDNNMTNGRFYLRRGYIEEDLYYQYMVQLGNGGFKANKVKSDNATLFYDTGNYRVEWHKKTQKWLYFKNEVTYHEIYIPEGSITSDYSIDLE